MTVTAATLPSPARTTAIAAPSRLTSVDAYRGLVMFLMMAEVLRLSRVAQTLLLARSHSAILFVSGRRRGAVLDREPDGARPVARADDAARRLAFAGARPAGRVPALDQPPDDLLDIRGHPQPDRSRLHRSLRARLPAGARSVDGPRPDPWNANSRTNILDGNPKTISKQRDIGYSIGGDSEVFSNVDALLKRVQVCRVALVCRWCRDQRRRATNVCVS